MNFITYKQLQRDVIDWSTKLPRDFDAIVGIERSGVLPASILAMQLNIPFLSLNDFARGVDSYAHSKISIPELKKVLIIDDSVSSGQTIKDVKDFLGGYLIRSSISYGAVYATLEGTRNVDYHYKELEHPRMFQWNFMNHEALSEAILDIDGVIFKEPPFENDVVQYVEYLKNPSLLYIPRRPVLGIVTGRLEKYKDVTEFWLRKLGIEYGFLMMADFNNPEERRKYGVGKYKAQIYESMPAATLYIESSHEQAMTIKNMTKKQVICVDDFDIM